MSSSYETGEIILIILYGQAHRIAIFYNFDLLDRKCVLTKTLSSTLKDIGL